MFKNLPHTSANMLYLAMAIASSSTLAQEASRSESSTQRALIERIEAIERHIGVNQNADNEVAAGDSADLDRRLRVLERKIELQEGAAAAKALTDPVVSLASNKGLSIKSPDGVELKLRGVVHADGRLFVDDDRTAQNDTFLLRRIRPSLEGSWGPLLGFRLTPEFAGDSTTLIDAYVDLKFDPRATVRIGKVKGPVGLERLQSASGIALVERGFPTELAPNPDLGVQLQGELLANRLSYTLGIYNGAPDGRDAATTNADNEFEYAGRIFWEPFKNSANAFSGLGVGIAASVGETFGTGNNVLPRYRTPAQSQFFSYNANVAGDGLRRRISPQAYYYVGRYGVLGEYITSEQEVRITSGAASGNRKLLEHEAWQITGSVVLTGEDASYRGVVKPTRPFTVGGDGWGALELVGRYGVLTLDDATFPLFANDATSARDSRAWTFGLNWYLNSNLKLAANYAEASFDGGAAENGDREEEKSLFTRAQFSF